MPSLFSATPVLIAVLSVVMMLLSAQFLEADAAACGCPIQASSLASLVINSTSSSNSDSSRMVSDVQTTPGTPTTAAIIRIDDMLIPIEDLIEQQPPASSDKLRAAKASSSSSNILPSSYVSCSRLWPNGRVYYRFHASFPSPSRALVRQSLAILTAKVSSTNAQQQLISFVELNSSSTNEHHVHVINGSGCHSFVGKMKFRTGNSQDLSLAIPGCMYERIVQHEFMHALGFYHEQSRPDRDKFISVLWNNINNETCNNFVKFSFILPSDYPLYDYHSVMHYGTSYFACKSGLKTMTMSNGSSIHPENNLTSIDIDKLSYTYSTANFAYCSTANPPRGCENTKTCSSTSIHVSVDVSFRLLWIAAAYATVFVASL